MLDKNTNTTDKYKLNNKTVLTVKNQKVEDEKGEIYFRTQVTLKHSFASLKPLSFDNPDQIADFVNNIDFDEEQLSLLNEDTNS